MEILLVALFFGAILYVIEQRTRWRPCPKCRQRVPKKATVCSHCQAELV